VVRIGAAVFHVRGELDGAPSPTAHRSVGLGYDRATKRKRASLDGVEQSRLTAALGAVPSVCFSPADVALVAGGPGERRHFLDVALALSSRHYLHALGQYRAALLRRNAALRTAQRDGGRGVAAHDARVAVWEHALAQHGGVVAAARHAFVRRHAERFRALADAIGERQAVTMRYVATAGVTSGMEVEDPGAQAVAYSLAFEAQRGTELRRGTTLVGPHRDELDCCWADASSGCSEARVSSGVRRSPCGCWSSRPCARRSRSRRCCSSTTRSRSSTPAARRACWGCWRKPAWGRPCSPYHARRISPPAFTRLERRRMCEGTLT
jgi:DNA replication and repair protein RecF